MTTEHINIEKLRIFNSYDGDIDGFCRNNKANEKEIFGENLSKNWTFITNIIQDLELISKRQTSYEYAKKTFTELEKNTDKETFELLTQKVDFYSDFQKVRQILEQIRNLTKPETDTVWAGYDSSVDFLNDLNQYIEKIEYCDFETLNKLEMEFAPTSTYQEISLSNGWSAKFLEIAEQFDKLHDRLINYK